VVVPIFGPYKYVLLIFAVKTRSDKVIRDRSITYQENIYQISYVFRIP